MPARPTDPKVLSLRGTLEANKRKRANTPQPLRPIGSPPVHMTKESKQIWKRLVKDAPAGYLACSDRAIMEILCGLIAEYRADPAGMQSSRLALLQNVMSKCGLSPADRGKVVPVEMPDDRANPFAEFDVDPLERFRDRVPRGPKG